MVIVCVDGVENVKKNGYNESEKIYKKCLGNYE